MLLGYIAYGVAFVAALFMTIMPRKIWEIFQSWKAEEEPPDSYFIIMRVAGIFMLILIFSLVVTLVKSSRNDFLFSLLQ